MFLVKCTIKPDFVSHLSLRWDTFFAFWDTFCHFLTLPGYFLDSTFWQFFTNACNSFYILRRNFSPENPDFQQITKVPKPLIYKGFGTLFMADATMINMFHCCVKMMCSFIPLSITYSSASCNLYIRLRFIVLGIGNASG